MMDDFEKRKVSADVMRLRFVERFLARADESLVTSKLGDGLTQLEIAYLALNGDFEEAASLAYNLEDRSESAGEQE